VRATDNGIPAETLITAVKNSVKRAGVSATSEHPDFRVSAVQLILTLIATTTRGGSVDFRVPFLGMQLRAGATVSRQDTHSLDLMLVPPGLPGPEIRDGDVESALVEAITTIRAVVASAAAGDDPWALATGTVDITFAVTETGSISLGLHGELVGQLTHTLRLTLTPATP